MYAPHKKHAVTNRGVTRCLLVPKRGAHACYLSITCVIKIHIKGCRRPQPGSPTCVRRVPADVTWLAQLLSALGVRMVAGGAGPCRTVRVSPFASASVDTVPASGICDPLRTQTRNQ
jgi:hypothetical protein